MPSRSRRSSDRRRRGPRTSCSRSERPQRSPRRTSDVSRASPGELQRRPPRRGARPERARRSGAGGRSSRSPPPAPGFAEDRSRCTAILRLEQGRGVPELDVGDPRAHPEICEGRSDRGPDGRIVRPCGTGGLGRRERSVRGPPGGGSCPRDQAARGNVGGQRRVPPGPLAGRVDLRLVAPTVQALDQVGCGTCPSAVRLDRTVRSSRPSSRRMPASTRSSRPA